MALVVEAVWDDDASVWVATSEDIPGLVTEAATLDELRSKLADIVPELLAENAPSALRDWPLPIEIGLSAMRASRLALRARTSA